MTHTRQQIVASARKFIGTPWVDEGRSTAGCDCVGLLCLVGWDLGIPFEDLRGYNNAPTDMRFLSHLRKYLPLNRTWLMLPGSVALIRQSQFACHVGIFATEASSGERSLIHSYSPRGGVIEERLIQSDRFKVTVVLDFPGVTN